MSNYSENARAIDQYRKELLSMMDDIRKVDEKILNQAMNEGVAFAKRNSPVITGFYRKNWHKKRNIRTDQGVESELVNTAEYASYVNDGHRKVDKDGNTTGFVRSKLGDHLLEKTGAYIEKRMEALFEKEVKAVQKKHDK